MWKFIVRVAIISTMLCLYGLEVVGEFRTLKTVPSDSRRLESTANRSESDSVTMYPWDHWTTSNNANIGETIDQESSDSINSAISSDSPMSTDSTSSVIISPFKMTISSDSHLTIKLTTLSETSSTTLTSSYSTVTSADTTKKSFTFTDSAAGTFSQEPSEHTTVATSNFPHVPTISTSVTSIVSSSTANLILKATSLSANLESLNVSTNPGYTDPTSVVPIEHGDESKQSSPAFSTSQAPQSLYFMDLKSQNPGIATEREVFTSSSDATESSSSQTIWSVETLPSQYLELTEDPSTLSSIHQPGWKSTESPVSMETLVTAESRESSSINSKTTSEVTIDQATEIPSSSTSSDSILYYFEVTASTSLPAESTYASQSPYSPSLTSQDPEVITTDLKYSTSTNSRSTLISDTSSSTSLSTSSPSISTGDTEDPSSNPFTNSPNSPVTLTSESAEILTSSVSSQYPEITTDPDSSVYTYLNTTNSSSSPVLTSSLSVSESTNSPEFTTVGSLNTFSTSPKNSEGNIGLTSKTTYGAGSSTHLPYYQSTFISKTENISMSSSTGTIDNYTEETGKTIVASESMTNKTSTVSGLTVAPNCLSSGTSCSPTHELSTTQGASSTTSASTQISDGSLPTTSLTSTNGPLPFPATNTTATSLTTPFLTTNTTATSTSLTIPFPTSMPTIMTKNSIDTTTPSISANTTTSSHDPTTGTLPSLSTSTIEVLTNATSLMSVQSTVNFSEATSLLPVSRTTKSSLIETVTTSKPTLPAGITNPCKCSPSLFCNKTTNICQDIDECLIPGICSPPFVCRNVIGNYSCDCPSGYKLVSGTCNDVNECEEGIHKCSSAENLACRNTNGSFGCECKHNFSRDENGNCKDIDECALNTHTCDQKCVNTNNGYNCLCLEGFTYNETLKKCTNNTAPCTKIKCGAGKGVCIPGKNASLDKCVCFDGYNVSTTGQCENINECNSVTCQHGLCVNDDPGFHCKCDSGFTASKTSGLCNIDVNECEKSPGICGIFSKCTNNQGSYSCKCLDGYETNSEGKNCTEIDGCDINNGNGYCATLNRKCISHLGTYICSTCTPPFVDKGPDTICTTDNKMPEAIVNGNITLLLEYDESLNTAYGKQKLEQELRSAVNGAMGQVANVTGFGLTNVRKGSIICSYTMQLDEEIKADNISQILTASCAAVPGAPDTCFLSEKLAVKASSVAHAEYVPCEKDAELLCSKTGICEPDKKGSFTCRCKKGYKDINPDNKLAHCIDINECEQSDVCGAAQCINTVASYYCKCKDCEIYNSDTSLCEDSCENGGNCEADMTSDNYYCRCPTGYIGALCTMKNEELKAAERNVAIVGGVLGGVLGVLVIICIILIYRSRKWKRSFNTCHEVNSVYLGSLGTLREDGYLNRGYMS